MKKSFNPRTDCTLCGKTFDYLGVHLARTHSITAREYKEELDVPYSMPLTSEKLEEKQKEIGKKYGGTWPQNFKKSKAHRFKKGHSGRRRISKKERETLIERIKTVNKKAKEEICPICRIKTKHLASHLYNGHRMLRVDNC